MQTRVDGSTKREPEVLDIFEAQETVCLRPIIKFIPESVLVVFKKTLQIIDGKVVKDLTPNEHELMNIIIGMGNAHMLYALSCDEFTDTVWTPRLRNAVLKYRVKRDTIPLEEIRKSDCARRRNWFVRIKELFPSQPTLVDI